MSRDPEDARKRGELVSGPSSGMPAAQQLTNWSDLAYGRSPVSVCTSMPCNTPLERAYLTSLLTTDPPRLAHKIGQTISVRHLILDRRVRADGEELAHWLLILADDSAVDGSGSCLRNSMLQVLWGMGPPPWEPPLPLLVTAVECQTPEGAKAEAPAVSLDLAAYKAAIAKHGAVKSK